MWILQADLSRLEYAVPTVHFMSKLRKRKLYTKSTRTLHLTLKMEHGIHPVHYKRSSEDKAINSPPIHVDTGYNGSHGVHWDRTLTEITFGISPYT